MNIPWELEMKILSKDVALEDWLLIASFLSLTRQLPSRFAVEGFSDATLAAHEFCGVLVNTGELVPCTDFESLDESGT